MLAKKKQKKKSGRPAIKAPAKAPVKTVEPHVKDFLDMTAPSVVKFNTDHFICGSAYHCTLALRGYAATTEELALLRYIGEKSGVNLSIYTRQATAAEEDQILRNAENKNRMARNTSSRMKQTVTAEANLQDVAELIAKLRKNKEPLVHCAVFLDLSARDPDSLRAL